MEVPYLFNYHNGSILRLENRKAVALLYRAALIAICPSAEIITHATWCLTYFRPLHADAKAMWFSLPFERSPHLRWPRPSVAAAEKNGTFQKKRNIRITYAGVLQISNSYRHILPHGLGGKMSVQFRQGTGHFPVYLQQVTSVEKSMHYYFLKVYAVFNTCCDTTFRRFNEVYLFNVDCVLQWVKLWVHLNPIKGFL